MKLSDKIVGLRKSRGMSQEELSEKLNVSRQAVSRWEMGTAMPDAANILQLSKLFNVTTDYLLNDDYRSDNDLPKSKEAMTDLLHRVIICSVTVEVLILLLQFYTAIILQSGSRCFITLIPFVTSISGFEYIYCRWVGEGSEEMKMLRKRFYRITVWLGTYFPIRLAVCFLMNYYPRPYKIVLLECIIFLIYILTAININRRIR